MNRSKRPFTGSPSVVSKKFRRNTCLEDLSNELLYEVFDYLDGYMIYRAFKTLNIRFDNLLLDPWLFLKINLSSKLTTEVERLCREFIVPNRHHLLSLKIADNSIIDKFYNYCSLDSSFICLESIVLNNISNHNVCMILPFLSSLPRLFSLSIKLSDDCCRNHLSIYRLILTLPHLKYCKVEIFCFELYGIIIPMPIDQKPSLIERLLINHFCTIQEVNSLLLHTPCLRYLDCAQLLNSARYPINTIKDQITLPQLVRISIRFSDIKFYELERFLKPISQQLRVLRLNVCSDRAYLNADRWKELIQEHLPQLSEFYINICMLSRDNHFYPADYHRFYSLCNEKNWSLELDRNLYGFVLSIRSWKYSIERYHLMKPSTFVALDDRHVDSQIFPHSISSSSATASTNDICSNPYTPSIQLTLDFPSASLMDQYFIKKMKFSAIGMTFTHLNIAYEKNLRGLLVEIINLLPNLKSIGIRGTSVIENQLSSSQTSKIFSNIPLNNKITQVKFNAMNDFQDVDFLMNIFSRMEYFEVDCTINKNMINLLTHITRNSIKHMRYLRCLRIFILDANDKLINRMRTIIDLQRSFDSEEIPRDYKTHSMRNEVFVNWKT